MVLAVLAGGMPDLRAVNTTAFAADNLAGERTIAGFVASVSFTLAEFVLHHVEGLRHDDGGMAVLHILRNSPSLTFIFFVRKSTQKVFCKSHRPCISIFRMLRTVVDARSSCARCQNTAPS